MTLGGVGISMVGRNPGSPCVANAMPKAYDGTVVMCRVPILPAGTIQVRPIYSVLCGVHNA
jgi:hypothetical protein